MQSTLSQRLAFEGLEDITKRLEAMGKAGEQTFNQMRAAVDGMNVSLARLSAVSAQLQVTAARLAGIGQAGHTAAGGVQHFGQSIEGIDFSRTAQNLGLLLRGMGILDSRSIEIGQSLGKLGGVFTGIVGAIGTAVVGFGALSVAAAENIRTLTNQAAALGLTRDQFESFIYAADQVGVSQESLSRGLDRFYSNLGKARDEQQKLSEALGVTSEKNRIALAKLTLAADEQGLALDRNKDKQNNMRDAIASAALAAEKAKDAFQHHTDSVLHAQITAEKAQIAYDKLRESFNTTGMSARDAREAQLNLTEAQLRAKEAQEGVGEAEKKRKEETEALGKAYEKVQQAIAAFALAQKEARLEAEKQKIALDDIKLKMTEVGQAAEKTTNIFQKFGLNIDQEPVKVLEDFIEQLNALPNAADRDRAAMQAFGRSFYDLLPLLTKNKEELKALLEQSEKYKIVTDDDAKASTKLIAAYDTMKFALEQLKNAIGSIMGTNFVDFFQGIADAIARNKDEIRKFFTDMSASMGRWGDAIKTVLTPAFQVLLGILQLVGYALSSIKAAFDGVAESINKFTGMKLTGEDLIVGIIAARLAVTLLGAAFIQVAAAAGAFLGTITRIGTAIYAMGTASSVGLIPMLAALGPAGWIGLGLIAVSALVITFQGKWGDFFKFFADGIAIAKGTLEAFIDLIRSAIEAFGRLQQKKAGEPETPGAPRNAEGGRGELPSSAPQAGSSASNDFNTRVEQENPGLFQPHASGGWVGERPVSAESGEFITRKSMAERFSGLLEAINSGNMGGITDLMLPAPIAVGAGAAAAPRAGSDQAMFHLTIGDKTFKGLTAPRDTAEALLQHARTSSIVSGGKKPSWYGSG